MSLYDEHRQACSFEWVNLYFGWLRYGNRRVRYLPERVLRHFGRIEAIPKHPYESASPETTLVEISYRYAYHHGHVLTAQELGLPARQGAKADQGYIRWFYTISHQCMILLDEDVQVPMPLEQKALDEIAAE